MFSISNRGILSLCTTICAVTALGGFATWRRYSEYLPLGWVVGAAVLGLWCGYIVGSLYFKAAVSSRVSHALRKHDDIDLRISSSRERKVVCFILAGILLAIGILPEFGLIALSPGSLVGRAGTMVAVTGTQTLFFGLFFATQCVTILLLHKKRLKTSIQHDDDAY